MCSRVLSARLMGESAVSAKKLVFGNLLTVLGIEVWFGRSGARFKPDLLKVEKRVAKIESFLAAGIMFPGEASKLGGALQWASQWTFRRLGRAMLRPIFQ